MRLAAGIFCVVLLFAGTRPGWAQEVDASSGRQTLDVISAQLRLAEQRIDQLTAALAQEQKLLADLTLQLRALSNASSGTESVAPSASATPARFEFYGDTLFRLMTLHQGFDGCRGCP